MMAHRLSTARYRDFMLDEGRLVAQGSYDELMVTSEDSGRMA